MFHAGGISSAEMVEFQLEPNSFLLTFGKGFGESMDLLEEFFDAFLVRLVFVYDDFDLFVAIRVFTGHCGVL